MLFQKCFTGSSLDLTYLIIGVPIGMLTLMVGVVAFNYLKKKIKRHHGDIADDTCDGLKPLNTSGRPLSLDQFRQRTSACCPQKDEFEKMEKDARARNISKSKTAAMEFATLKIPINR